MRRSGSCCFLLIAISFLISCGSSRRLQSITIAQSGTSPQFQFVATGHFSSAPTTVTPLAVDWVASNVLSPPPAQYSYNLTSQPYSYNCSKANPQSLGAVTALAPVDPNAPVSGTTKNVVTATMPLSCQ